MNNVPTVKSSKVNWQYVALALLAIGIVAFWVWLQAARQEGQYPVFAVALFWILVLSWLLWLGNGFIYRLLSRRYSWEGAFRHRLGWQLLLTFLYSLTCINLSYYFFKTNFTELPPDRNQLILVNIYGILFLVPVLSIQ